MKYTPEQRTYIIEDAIGKTIHDLVYVEEGDYWTMKFTDGTEMDFKFTMELEEVNNDVD